jgi:hypothetical protein
LQTSDAIGAAAAQLGPQVIALVVVLNKQLGLSFGKIVTLLQQRYGLTPRTGPNAGLKPCATSDLLLRWPGPLTPAEAIAPGRF